MSEVIDATVLGSRIREARHPMTQAQLAKRLGVHPMTVSEWERGVSRPTMIHMLLVARETGRFLSWFLEPTATDEGGEDVA